MGLCGSTEYDNRPYVPPNIPRTAPIVTMGATQQPARQQVLMYNGGAYGPSGPPGPPPPYSPPANVQYPPQPFSDLNRADEIEPMLLLDVTGSMQFSTSPNSTVKRRDTVEEAIGMIVGEIAKHDSQAVHEQGEGGEGGGLRTITFASGQADDIGDLNPANLRQKWQRIRWGGGTYIAVGWQKLKQVYREEFQRRPPAEQPKLLALVVTDGEAQDNDQFVQLLDQESRSTYIVIALLGHGQDHENATRRYADLAARNNHVKLVNFGPETDPSQICAALTKFLF